MKRQDLLAFALIPAAAAAGVLVAPGFGAGAFGFGLGGAIAGTALAGLVLHRRLMGELARIRDHADETRRQAAALARVTRELSHRISLLDGARGEGTETEERENGQIAVLGGLVRDLAVAVAELETRVEEAVRQPEPARTDIRPEVRPAVRREPEPEPRESLREAYRAELQAARREPAPRPQTPARPEPAPERFALHETALFGDDRPATETLAAKEGRRLVAAAIAADRFELHLQPISSLPQRRPKLFEVMLRPEGASAGLSYAMIREAVAGVGHQPAFDRDAAVRAIRVAQVLEQRGREGGVLIETGAPFLASARDTEDFAGLLADEPALARRLVLAVPQAVLRGAGAGELDLLGRMVRLGLRLAITELEDLRIDPLALSERGFRFVRIDAARLLNAAASPDLDSEVVPADFAALLARRGLSIIASGVETEATVAELIDLNVQLAQGGLISAPRPFRIEAERPAPGLAGEDKPALRGLRHVARQAG